MNRPLKVNMRGMFRVKKGEVPPYIRAADLPPFSGNIGVKLIGGKIALQGAPIHTLAWELSPTGNAKIYLEAKREMTLEDNYLNIGLDFLEDTFKAFFSKEATNV